MTGRLFARALRWSSALAAACGLAALVIGGERGAVAIVASVASIVACAAGWRPPIPARAWVVIQMLFLLGLGWAAWGMRVHVLTVFGWLLLFVQGHRLLTHQGARDDRYVLFIAFGELLLASILTVDAVFFGLFVTYAVVACAGMLLAGLAATAEDGAAVPRGQAVPLSVYAPLDALIRPAWVAAVVALSGLLLLGTLALFFLLPRLQGNLGAGLLPPLPVSGFDERVRLGALGSMQLSTEPVLRARFTDSSGKVGPPARDLYWRGLALDQFDGRTWTQADAARTTLLNGAGPDHRGPPRERPWTLRADITLEPLDTKILFVPDRVAGLYGPFRSLDATSTDGFEYSGPKGRLEYTTYSNPSTVDGDVLRLSGAPRSVPPGALQLPDKLDPRIVELARSWTDGAASDYDRALLVTERLGRFVYSLDMAASAYPDPLAAFLLDVEEGHCEYFASGMTILLRSVGVPARMVNGFLGGEWNELGGYLVVRQLHAHSWVEVWFDNRGWVPFDPTPASTLSTGEARLSWLGRVRAALDYGSVLWASVMLDYGLDSQSAGFRAGLRWIGQWLPGGQGGGQARGEEGGTSPEPGEQVRSGPWLALLVTALLAGAGAVLARRSGPTLPPAARAAYPALQALLQAWARQARESGGTPPAPETSSRWAAWAESHLSDQDGSRALIDRWNAVRWGGAEDQGLARALKDQRRRLRASTQRRQGVGPNDTGQ